MNPSFDGIKEKLQRSYENIRNLETEIDRFFKKSKYPVIVDENNQFIPEALDYFSGLAVPLRFSVLCGEIIHNLRSCFDHVAWMLSDPRYRSGKLGKYIDFPVLKKWPSAENLFTSYTRKIQGIKSPDILRLIERLQPCNTTADVDSLLGILHEFDISDKHQELVLCITTPVLGIPTDVFERWMRYQRGVPGSVPVDFADEFENNGQISITIAFPKFGRLESEPVAQALWQLQTFTAKMMASFDNISNVRP